MKRTTICVLGLAFALFARGAVSVGEVEVLGAASSGEAALDTRETGVRVVPFPFELDVEYGPGLASATGGVAEVLVDGEVWRTSATDAMARWSAPEGRHVLAHRVVVDGVPVGAVQEVVFEVWVPEVTVADGSKPLREQFPLTYSNLVAVTVADGVTSVCEGFLDGCAALERTVLPDSL